MCVLTQIRQIQPQAVCPTGRFTICPFDQEAALIDVVGVGTHHPPAAHAMM